MKSLRILIADDESLRLMSLRAQLEKLGHRVVGEASDGRTAVSLAHEVRPDLSYRRQPGTRGQARPGHSRY